MNKDNVQEIWDKFEELVDQAEASADQEALWEIRNTGESLLMFYDAIRVTRGKNKGKNDYKTSFRKTYGNMSRP